jgi:hypothetical protein
MKKAAVFSFLLFLMTISQVYGQHRVNDVKAYNGWYKIEIESDLEGNSRYSITQCYPNRDEYKLSDSERRQLPLWIKVFCIGMYEEILQGQAESMIFDDGGLRMQIQGFILRLDASRTDEEVLESLGQEMVDTFKDRDW